MFTLNLGNKSLSLGLAGLLFTSLASADTFNGPDPYAAGFGFDTPTEAGLGWDRGDAGTIYAEWDQFTGASNPTTPDVGVSGTSSATFGWNAGTFAASSGNLYNFSGTAEIFDIDIDGSDGPATGNVLVTLQTETWGAELNSVLLNGVTADSSTVTYSDPAYGTSFGDVALNEVLYTWILAAPAATYNFDLTSPIHTSFAQAAVDIGPASAVPVPAAAWLFGSALLGLSAVGRNRKKAA